MPTLSSPGFGPADLGVGFRTRVETVCAVPFSPPRAVIDFRGEFPEQRLLPPEVGGEVGNVPRVGCAKLARTYAWMSRSAQSLKYKW